MPQVLAVAVLIEAWSEAAGQHHGIEDGDVDEDADAAPDGAVGSDLHAAPGLQPQEVLVVAVLQAKICRLVVLHLEVRSEEHTSELQSLMRISYAVFCLKK